MAGDAKADGTEDDFDLASWVGPSAGGLPTRLEGCAYDGKGKAWVPKRALSAFPKAGRIALLRGYTHQVEKAKSGASTCKRCGEKIAKAEVRVGYPVKDQRGDYGALPVWLHVKCARGDQALVRFARQGDGALRAKLLGYDALKKEERLQLCDDLLREGKEDEGPAPPPAVPAARCLERHPKPAALRVDMLPFQAEGLGWMLAREADPKTRGGVLADEMGMGKTLQTISVLLAGQARGPNLVVCPAAAMLQWRNEILRFVEPGALEVELYYGFERRKLDFNGRDRLVVLTTYQTLEADYRLEVNRYKVPCQWCERLFLPEKLRYHQKYFCGPDAERTEKQRKQERNNDLKTQAAKRMKIGGTETEITLNPLNAIRGCSAAALRARRQRWKAPPDAEPEAEPEAPSAAASSSSAPAPAAKRPRQPARAAGKAAPAAPTPLPFPASVLPDAAKAALGLGKADQQKVPDQQKAPSCAEVPAPGLAVVFDCPDAMRTVHFTRKPLGIVCDQRRPLEVTAVKEDGHAREMGVRRGWVMKSIGGEELCGRSVDEVNFILTRHVSALPAAGSPGGAPAPGEGEAPATPARKPGRGRGGGGRGGGRGRKRKSPEGEEAGQGAAAAGAGACTGPDAATPPPPSAAPWKRRWAKDRLLRPPAAGRKPGKAPPAPQGGQAAWGVALRPARGPSVISLDSAESGSDLELVGAGTGGGSPAVAEKGVPTVPPEWPAADAPSKGAPAEASEDAANAPSGAPAAANGLPPRPESESEEECGGAGGRMDLSRSTLFRTRWGRVILDEAHRIKGRTNSTAQAAFALKASARWCLSGTPLQNRVGEIYSIIRFLRFYPYAHYFCSKRGCSCCSLHYRFDPDTSLCTKCGHTKMMHRSHFASTVSNPIKKFGFLGAGKAAMERLRSEVLDRILLRRTKKERHSDLKLPPMEIKIRHDALSAEENDFYQAMYMNSLTKFDTYVDRGTVLHNYAHVFDLIMRLRQAVDHPYLIVHGSLRTENGLIPTQSRSEVAKHVCALCQDDIEDSSVRAVAQCGHAFHRDCVSEYLNQAPELASGGIGCPACFAPLTVNLEEDDGAAEEDAAGPPADGPRGGARSIMQRIKTAEFKSSTKIEALMQEVTRMMAADPASKALVFSQFTVFLELIEWRLKREGISCAKLLGSMPVASKSNIIISFQTDPSLKLLLISLKAGGEGLNLQAADHIFLMDPWWNPASELQAIQRAHRIGQTRPVRATRFVATGTIEEKIIELQQKKQTVFDCSVGNCNQALQRLTSDDIKFLFSQ